MKASATCLWLTASSGLPQNAQVSVTVSAAGSAAGAAGSAAAGWAAGSAGWVGTGAHADTTNPRTIRTLTTNQILRII